MEGPVERIEIQGKKVSLYRDGTPPTLDREVPLEDFLREVALAVRRPGRGHHLLLPPGTRIAKLEGTANVLCVEQPPQVRRIRWSASAMGKGGEYQTYRLAFPYVVYIFFFFQGSFEEMRVYYRTATLQSPNDSLLMPNLWNVQADPEKPSACRACLRGRPEDLWERPPVQQVTVLLDFFWGTGFNTDIAGNCFERARVLDPRIATLEAWEAASEADPFFPLALPWEQLGLTIGEVMDRLVQTGPQPRQAIAEATDLADLIYRIPKCE
ncbi:MAG: hypothetical protein ACE5I9_01750 [Candidatus Methylomirabilales bacterium]